MCQAAPIVLLSCFMQKYSRCCWLRLNLLLRSKSGRIFRRLVGLFFHLFPFCFLFSLFFSSFLEVISLIFVFFIKSSPVYLQPLHVSLYSWDECVVFTSINPLQSRKNIYFLSCFPSFLSKRPVFKTLRRLQIPNPHCLFWMGDDSSHNPFRDLKTMF